MKVNNTTVESLTPLQRVLAELIAKLFGDIGQAFSLIGTNEEYEDIISAIINGLKKIDHPQSEQAVILIDQISDIIWEDQLMNRLSAREKNVAKEAN